MIRADAAITMRSMKTIFFLPLFMAISLGGAVALAAGQAGYLMNGKTVIVYKDGEKVGEWPETADNQGKKPKRMPASVAKMAAPNVLYFAEDDLARCYYVSAMPALSGPIFCVKKK